MQKELQFDELTHLLEEEREVMHQMVRGIHDHKNPEAVLELNRHLKLLILQKQELLKLI